MRKFIIVLLVLGLGSVVFSGCTIFQTGPSIIKWEPGEEPRLGKAPQDGIYALYDSSDLDAKASASLKQGEELGFKKVDDKLVAVAGGDTFPISDLSSRHYWRFQTP